MIKYSLLTCFSNQIYWIIMLNQNTGKDLAREENKWTLEIFRENYQDNKHN